MSDNIEFLHSKYKIVKELRFDWDDQIPDYVVHRGDIKCRTVWFQNWYSNFYFLRNKGFVSEQLYKDYEEFTKVFIERRSKMRERFIERTTTEEDIKEGNNLLDRLLVEIEENIGKVEKVQRN